AAEELAVAAEGVRPGQESRRGLRSNGSEFTVRTLLQYYLHDSLHHLQDDGAEAPHPSPQSRRNRPAVHIFRPQASAHLTCDAQHAVDGAVGKEFPWCCLRIGLAVPTEAE